MRVPRCASWSAPCSSWILQRRLVHPAAAGATTAQALGNAATLADGTRAHCANLQWRWQTAQQRCAWHVPAGAADNRQAESGRRLQEAMRRTLERYDARLAAAGQHLLHLDPRQVLARGYSMVAIARGVVVDARHWHWRQADIAFAHGWAKAEVKEKGEEPR